MSSLIDREYNIIELFPVSIYQTNIPIPEKNNIINVEYERLEEHHCWFSKSFYILDEFNSLKKRIIKEFDFFINDVIKIDTTNLDFYMTTSWVVRHAHGDYGNKHIHTNSLFSGVLYLDVNDDSGDISFEKTNECKNLISQSFDFEYKEWNRYNCLSHTLRPKNGDLIFFPSHIPHAITPNNSCHERFVVAFNFFIKGSVGKRESKLTL